MPDIGWSASELRELEDLRRRETGTWDDRIGYIAGSYTVSACTSTGGCGGTIPPGQSVVFTKLATGTGFTIH